ncbi:MAG: class I fructose-bisphosphate aldolase [Pseudomonadota bacterium]
MKITKIVQKILAKYESEPPGVLRNLAHLLGSGRLGGTGRMIILPVDQGFEHGPGRSFAPNPKAYDPDYHFRLAIDARLNAFAAPLGMLESGARRYAGQIPLILKVNSSNSWATSKDQALTASVDDAVRLGCAAIGFTIYPGSDHALSMMEEIGELAREAKARGLAVVIWSYPRGPALDKAAETAIDVTAYAAHMAALLGAHIIKVKLPSAHIAQDEAREAYEKAKVDFGTLEKRVAHIVQSCFAGRRLVVFSGGAAKDEAALLEEASAIRIGGGNGSIVGRNSFQRSPEDALALLKNMADCYLRNGL